MDWSLLWSKGPILRVDIRLLKVREGFLEALVTVDLRTFGVDLILLLITVVDIVVVRVKLEVVLLELLELLVICRFSLIFYLVCSDLYLWVLLKNLFSSHMKFLE